MKNCLKSVHVIDSDGKAGQTLGAWMKSNNISLQRKRKRRANLKTITLLYNSLLPDAGNSCRDIAMLAAAAEQLDKAAGQEVADNVPMGM